MSVTDTRTNLHMKMQMYVLLTDTCMNVRTNALTQVSIIYVFYGHVYEYAGTGVNHICSYGRTTTHDLLSAGFNN